MNIPIEKRFQVLCEITRAQHFAWRQAALTLAPQLDPVELCNKMWEITGIDTAKAYVKHIDRDKPLALQVANSIAWSSTCMGETAEVEAGQGDEAFVKHLDCPWFHWHQRLGLLHEDRPGCDTWLRSTINEINKTVGCDLKFESQCTLPTGGDCCRRRIWTE